MSSTPDDFAARRHAMVVTQLQARGIRDPRVLEVMNRVPRHEFTDARYWAEAYDDHPLPIGHEQTISQPFIVALMLEALTLQPRDVVLEIGTGSGYTAALLAELSAHVYSIERHATLIQRAQQVLLALGYRNVTMLLGDGSRGAPAFAPYDAILVSAAAPEVPLPLFEQLNEGGRMVIPVGPAHAQELLLVRKMGGQPEQSILEGCRFVPLVQSTDERLY
jgi:protein-L-isoaspartate(D-aspartate) O-methyltransferase